jgi:hypothetical protein
MVMFSNHFPFPIPIEEDCKGKCNDKTTDTTRLIEKDCLPNPFEFSVKKWSGDGKWVDLISTSQCITVTPTNFASFRIW